MNIAIVIINYRTAQMTIECLASLQLEFDSASFRVVVVDNNSQDQSPEIIQQAIRSRGWETWVRLVRSPVNGGFSAGNNLGIQSIEADAYLLLNSDTIVHRGAVRTLIECVQQNPRTGLTGPRLECPDGTGQVSCFRFPSFFSEVIRGACTGPVTKLLQRWDVPLRISNTAIDAPWISFAAVLIRKEVLDQVGLMDEGYFMYFEDVDYCRRVNNAGWNIRYCPDAKVVHLHGQSSGVEELTSERKRRPRYYYAARSRYFRKWAGRFGLIAANLGWFAGRTISFARELLGRHPTSCESEWIDNWTDTCQPLAITTD